MAHKAMLCAASAPLVVRRVNSSADFAPIPGLTYAQIATRFLLRSKSLPAHTTYRSSSRLRLLRMRRSWGRTARSNYLDPLLDERSKTAVDFSLIGAHLGPRLARQITLVKPHHAPAKIHRHGIRVCVDESFHLLQPCAVLRGDLVEAFFDERGAPTIASRARCLLCCGNSDRAQAW